MSRRVCPDQGRARNKRAERQDEDDRKIHAKLIVLLVSAFHPKLPRHTSTHCG
jgi:hypothetical protein